MSSLINKAIVLKLNKYWQRIGWTTVGDAIISMCGMPGGTNPALALDITIYKDGNFSATPTKWEDWAKLPVRKCDLSIRSAKGEIRCPLVIVDPDFSDMPMKQPTLSNQAILERDKYIDQYTGEKLKPDDANVDHVIPRDVWKKRGLKGSPDRWDNMVCCKKERNFRKGNKLNGAMGLTLIRKPKAPGRIPVSSTIKTAKHQHHWPFLVG